jgi:hypothetical protein
MCTRGALSAIDLNLGETFDQIENFQEIMP